MDYSEGWLQRSSVRAEEVIRSIPYDQLGPAAKKLLEMFPDAKIIQFKRKS